MSVRYSDFLKSRNESESDEEPIESVNSDEENDVIYKELLDQISYPETKLIDTYLLLQNTEKTNKIMESGKKTDLETEKNLATNKINEDDNQSKGNNSFR